MGNVGQSQRKVPGKLFFVLGPEGAVSAAKLQDLHAFPGPVHPEQPGKPAFFILGVKAVETDTVRNISGIQILAFQTLFHAGEMNQVQHMAPVNAVVFPDLSGSIFDSLFHQLQLFDPVLDQLLLKGEGIQGKVIICVIDGHFFNVFQRKPQIFQQQDLLEPGKILICIKTRPGGGHVRRLQNILFVIKADSAHRNMSHFGKLSGSIVSGWLHRRLLYVISFIISREKEERQVLFLNLF